MSPGLNLPRWIRLRSWRLYCLTFAWPVAMDCPLKKNVPKSKANWPFFARSSVAAGILRYEHTDHADSTGRSNGLDQAVDGQARW